MWTTRVMVGGALLALVVSGLGAVPASADRDDPDGRGSTTDRGILEHEVPVDMAPGPTVFYPARDQYRDYFDLKLIESPETDEVMRDIDFELTDPAGNVIRTATGDPYDLVQYGRVYFGWDGRYEDRAGLYPEGVYTITATVVDSSNDRKVLTREIRLDHARKQWVRWTRTFPAADTLIEKHVGRCAALRRPARRGWAGSLGYRSRCRSGERSVVSTVHGVDLPEPFRDWYYTVRLSMYGGHAKGSPESRLQYFYLSRSGRWMHTLRPFSSELGTHRGFRGSGRYVLGNRHDEPPHFIWSVGLGDGQAYDVKSFTVTAVYPILK